MESKSSIKKTRSTEGGLTIETNPDDFLTEEDNAAENGEYVTLQVVLTPSNNRKSDETEDSKFPDNAESGSQITGSQNVIKASYQVNKSSYDGNSS